jgi:TPR repeat protein
MAAEWYTKAASQGRMHAQFNLGTMPPAATVCLKWATAALRKAADQDHPIASSILALYHTGDGPQDFAVALTWFSKAAKPKCRRAEYAWLEHRKVKVS